MQTSLFDFHLPESHIATSPANPRDSARMLVVGQGIHDDAIANLPNFLKPNDIVMFNNTRVIPARLHGKRGEAGVEILLHKRSLPHRGRLGVGASTAQNLLLSKHAPLLTSTLKGEGWQCFAKPAKRLKEDDRINFAEGFFAIVEHKQEDGQILLRFNVEGEAFKTALAQHGSMPLPPYIEKKRTASAQDNATYQTIYAQREGSVAAPTAGLHFTEALLKAIDATGAKRATVTLHVGGGTFLPVKVDNTNDHIMHGEWAEITPETARQINQAKAKGGRVICIGTTSLRTLESAADEQGVIQPFQQETAIFITPGYRFKCVDMLLTNFHLPKSTLFMLVCAFSGLEAMQTAYQHAIQDRYRFYSYGDACLLYKAAHLAVT